MIQLWSHQERSQDFGGKGVRIWVSAQKGAGTRGCHPWKNFEKRYAIWCIILHPLHKNH